jgi:hypothetical protein
MSKDCCASRRGPCKRRQDSKRGRFSRAIWPEQTKDGAALDGKAQIIDGSKFFVCPASIDFDEMVNSNRNVVHDNAPFENVPRRMVRQTKDNASSTDKY